MGRPSRDGPMCVMFDVVGDWWMTMMMLLSVRRWRRFLLVIDVDTG